MSNTDKAIELSNKFKCITICERCKNIEDACYKMAAWKEQQLIEKAAKWLDDNEPVYRKYDGSGFYNEKNQYLIEDFKKAMLE